MSGAGLFASPAMRFLICGGLAAAVNWFARIGLSQWMSFEAAVAVAYAIGMVAGFVLYRTFVWPDHNSSLKRQLVGFLIVNAGSAVIVFLASVGVREALGLVQADGAIADAAAHGLGIAVGALVNFAGHRAVTFKAAG